MTTLIQCVPNFSEGRDPVVIASIVDAVRAVPQVRLVDWSADSDHNRMVLTFVGPPEPILDACRAVTDAAIRGIDLRTHTGIHPRLGALDVLPLVPLAGITLDGCASLARMLGQELAHVHALPVFLYEAASPEERSLPSVRKEAFAGLMPDFGPRSPHPTAGAATIGARGPLIAYNVNLATHDVRIAKRIARELREGGGAGFSGVRALGLFLDSCHQTQVSMNITRPAETSLLALTNYIARRAGELGAVMAGSEVIGALPGGTALGVIAEALQTNLKSGQILWETFLP